LGILNTDNLPPNSSFQLYILETFCSGPGKDFSKSAKM
jgi:hypothetical protein